MEVKKVFSKTTQIILFVIFLVSIGLNIWLLTKENEYKTKEKVVIREVHDTIRDTMPQIKKQLVIKHIQDTLLLVDTVPGDTTQVVVDVPITQKEYSNDSLYRVWVSGYKVNMDSIDIFRKTVYIDRTVTQTKKQRFIIGPQVGYSYDFVNKKFGPTIGIGITYNLIGF